MFTHFKSMEATDSLDMAILDTRGMNVCRGHVVSENNFLKFFPYNSMGAICQSSKTTGNLSPSHLMMLYV